MKIGLFGVCYFTCLQLFAQNDLTLLGEDKTLFVLDSGRNYSAPELNLVVMAANQECFVFEQDSGILAPGRPRGEIMHLHTTDPFITNSEDANKDGEVVVDSEIMGSQVNGEEPPSLSFTDSRELFFSQAAFAFNGFGFRPGGYNANAMVVYINGALINDLVSGGRCYGLWGGLNVAFKNHRLTRGLNAAPEGFGGRDGSNAIDITAARQQKGRQVAYSISNSGYRNRLLLTYSSGLLPNSWAFAAALSKRWAKEGYIPGTFSDAYAYYFALSRKLGINNSLHFTSFGSSMKQGLAAATSLEAMELAGSHYYNPCWGYQEDEIRNARVTKSFQPVFLLNYKWEPDTSTLLNIVAGFRTGYSENSGLDWYNAQDPRPDYYRNLPGYYLYAPNGTDSQTANAIRQEWQNNPAKAQINWSRMYEVNGLNWETVNGVYGKRALYVVGADRNDSKKYSLDAHFQKKLGNKFTLHSGFNFISQQTERYRKMLDLLGGDYFVNLNQFAERTYLGNTVLNQQDLNHPDQLIKNGDKYNYHYLVHFVNAQAFSQGSFTFNKFFFFLAGVLKWNVFSREGLYKNGLFPDNSYGKSKVEKFLSYSGKAGIQYSLNPGYTLFLNGAYGTLPPAFDAVFYAPRNRNATLPKPVTEQFFSAEGGYIMDLKHVRAQIILFAGDIKDKTEVLRYYDESYRNFVNYAMQGIDIRHMGIEFAFQATLFQGLSAGIGGSWMQVFYTSRPDITVYPDNDTSSGIGKDKVYWKDYYVGSGPQSAYTFNLKYVPVRHGFVSGRVNYLHRAYVSLNPARHTENAIEPVPAGSEQWHEILDQEQLPAIFTVDLMAGKSFDLKKKTKGSGTNLFLHIGVGVNNILNNTNILVSGHQQLRFDYSSRRPERFPDKYRYGYGRTWYLNVSLKF